MLNVSLAVGLVGVAVVFMLLLLIFWRRLSEIEALKEFAVATLVALVTAGVMTVFKDDSKTVAKLVAVMAVGMVVLIFQRIQRLEKFVSTTLTHEVRDNLIRTNALVPHDKRLAITAQIIDFPPETEYAMPEGREGIETIDVIRQFEYQNYVFTPAYLSFLSYRCAHSKISRKVIVVSEPSQPALVFISFCAWIGYRTIVMSSTRFREFVEANCVGQNGSKLRPMIKGNPSLAKMIDGGMVHYLGKYTDRKKARGMGLGEHVSCNNQGSWNLLLRLVQAGHDVTDAVRGGRLNDVGTLRCILDDNERERLVADVRQDDDPARPGLLAWIRSIVRRPIT